MVERVEEARTLKALRVNKRQIIRVDWCVLVWMSSHSIDEQARSPFAVARGANLAVTSLFNFSPVLEQASLQDLREWP
jgi:hypothetical protein